MSGTKQTPSSLMFRLFINSEPQASGCWQWTKALGKRGYADIHVGRSVSGACTHFKKKAHRVMYEFWYGPVPANLDMDHLCRNKGCINPNHLEPVPRSVNAKRGLGPAMAATRNLARTHCKNGHPFAGENLKLREGRYRRCAECCRIAARKCAARKRERQKAKVVD